MLHGKLLSSTILLNTGTHTSVVCSRCISSRTSMARHAFAETGHRTDDDSAESSHTRERRRAPACFKLGAKHKKPQAERRCTNRAFVRRGSPDVSRPRRNQRPKVSCSENTPGAGFVCAHGLRSPRVETCWPRVAVSSPFGSDYAAESLGLSSTLNPRLSRRLTR